MAEKTRFVQPVTIEHPLGWKCEICFHAVKDPTPGSKQMKCCRYPPRGEAIKQQGQIVGWMSVSPPVQEGEWCGEWKPVAPVMQ